MCILIIIFQNVFTYIFQGKKYFSQNYYSLLSFCRATPNDILQPEPCHKISNYTLFKLLMVSGENNSRKL